jgi:hypothetical protein
MKISPSRDRKKFNHGDQQDPDRKFWLRELVGSVDPGQRKDGQDRHHDADLIAAEG